MSMDHKAYAFDWHRFQAKLYLLLTDALISNKTLRLQEYIATYLHDLTDPYEGESLTTSWRLELNDINDVQECGDFALTLFYNPSLNFGLGNIWVELSETLPSPCQRAMLGQTIGPKHHLFDPGKMGSYFQSPEQVISSIQDVSRLNESRLHNTGLSQYLSFLNTCYINSQGLYVTF